MLIPMDKLREWFAERLPWMQYPPEHRLFREASRPQTVPLTLRVGLALFFTWTIFVCCILLAAFGIIVYALFFENS